jgi:hypothetical protein
LIKHVLLSSDIPLKIFITSHDEPLTRAVFDLASFLRCRFILHEVGKDVVEGDIRKYVETSLSEVRSPGCDDAGDMSKLIRQCGTLFIYAATAVHYIAGACGFSGNRLSAVASRSTTKRFQASLDDLYGQILEQACADMEEDEVNNMRHFAADIIFLQDTLPIQAIASLSEQDIRPDQLRQYLSPLHSVIHVPDQEEAAVTLFHASFFDFITNLTCCTINGSWYFASLSSFCFLFFPFLLESCWVVHSFMVCLLLLSCIRLFHSQLLSKIRKMSITTVGHATASSVLCLVAENLTENHPPLCLASY